MTRFVIVTCLMGCVAACTGPSPSDDGRMRDISTRHVPEPTTPGVHISGQVIVGVSTVN